MSKALREDKARYDRTISAIDKAVAKAYRESGAIGQRELAFVHSAVRNNTTWVQAMIEGGYAFERGKRMLQELGAQVRAGRRFDDLDYEDLYLNELTRQ